MIDRMELVTNEESIEMARRLAREEGILVRHFLRRRGSCGGSPRARAEFAGKTIVTVLPDSGERYLSTALFEGFSGE